MKHHKGRSKSSYVDNGDIVFEEEIHELADAISECENSQEDLSFMTDPFEEYLDTMRTKIYTNPHIFRTRLAKGYHALLRELEHPENHS